jgi:hypothetical protein
VIEALRAKLTTTQQMKGNLLDAAGTSRSSADEAMKLIKEIQH